MIHSLILYAIKIVAMLAIMTISSPLRAETPLPDWVETGLTQKQLISQEANASSDVGNHALDEILALPYWMFESGPFATVEEAEAEALGVATKHLQYVCTHSADGYDGWFDLLNTGHTWNLPPQLVRNYAVSDKFVEEKQHSLGNVSATMYNVYIQVPNEPRRLGVLMEHRRQTISRERTWALGLGFGVITWECFCIALGLRLYQWSKGSWRGKVLAASLIGGTLPVLLVIA
ncbi:MAG: hypothetical protein WD065_07145 [Planctomycetaceae bacterium]